VCCVATTLTFIVLATQPDDLEALQDLLATRLVKSIGGLHFQVAERTLCLWNR
jgi:hypothetical protein